ncbi:MAG: metallophosphoesterase [Acidobacteriota bacterium]
MVIARPSTRNHAGTSPRLLPLVLLLAVYLPLSTQASSPTPPTEDQVHAHFVVLGSVKAEAGNGTVAYARVVQDLGLKCPTVVSGEQSLKMVTRDNPHGFPVTVCEARVGFDEELTVQLAEGTLALPTVRKNPEKVLVFGDTGCKLPKAGKEGGCAVGSPAEPFGRLTRAAAEGPAADLILHLGDMNYRGTPGPTFFTVPGEGDDAGLIQQSHWPYDAGDGSPASAGCEQGEGALYWSNNAPNAAYADHWQTWKDDLFAPAAELLPLAPWVFSRGNHELCSRAGPGYFYFLDPHSNLGDGQLSCPQPQVEEGVLKNEVMTPPYAVDLGSLRIVSLDSANACDFFLNPGFTALYAQQLTEVSKLVEGASTAWITTHRPIWGVDGFEAEKSKPCSAEKKWSCLNQTLQQAIRQSPGGKLPSPVQLVLSGHMHRFEAVTFQDQAHPPQVVIGNSGVQLEAYPPAGEHQVQVADNAAHLLATAAEVSTGTGAESKTQGAFGYLEVTLAEDGSWTGVLQDAPAGAEGRLEIATCGSKLAQDGAVCRLAPGVEAVEP